MRNRNPDRDIRGGHGRGTRRVWDKYDPLGRPEIEFSLSDVGYLLVAQDTYLADGDGAVLLWSPL